MASTTEYEVKNVLTDKVSDVLNKPEHSEFQALRDLEIVILSCFIVKTDDEGTLQPVSGEPCKVRKVPPYFQLFMKPKPHYLLLMDSCAWENARDDSDRCALIHFALMHIKADQNKAGYLRLRTHPPDVVAYVATLNRYKAWTDALDEVRDTFQRSTRMLPRKAPAAEPEAEPVLDEEN